MLVWKVLSWFRRLGVVEFMFLLAIAQNVLLMLAFSSLKFEVRPHSSFSARNSACNHTRGTFWQQQQTPPPLAL